MPTTPPSALAGLEAALIARSRRWMSESGLSTAASTDEAPNVDTLAAIARGMDALRAPPAEFGRPTAAEVAAAGRPYLLLDLAEFWLIEAIVQNRTKVTEAVKGRSKNSSDLLKAMSDRLAALEKRYYRYLAPPLVGGRIDVRSAARRGTRPEI
jgi:hypothetical protein